MGSTADGKPLELAAGNHKVRVVGSNGRSASQVVRVDVDRPSMVQFTLR